MSDQAEVRAYILGTKQLGVLADVPNERALAAFERIVAHASETERKLNDLLVDGWCMSCGKPIGESYEEARLAGTP